MPTTNNTTANTYGQWHADPDGTPEDPSRCVREVYGGDGSRMIGRQCARKRGHGVNGEHCKQHAAEAIRNSESN